MVTVRRGRVATALCGLVAALPWAACTSTPTSPGGLEVIIAAEGLSAPADFDDVRLQVEQQAADGTWASKWDRDYIVPSPEATLPATFAIVDGPTPLAQVLVTVTAYKGRAADGGYGMPVVLRRAQVQVPSDRRSLWMVLAKDCEGQVTTDATGAPQPSCTQSGYSCQPDTGACGSNVVDPTVLQPYVPGQDLDAGPPRIDATASSVSDATASSVMDATSPPAVDSGGLDASAGDGRVPTDAPSDAPGDAPFDGGEAGPTTGGGDGGPTNPGGDWAAWPMPNGSVDVTNGAPNPEKYTVNGDGTVTDGVTHLMWQQGEGPATYAWGDPATAGTAQNYCATLALAGHSDWRLPTKIELVSLVDPTFENPTIDGTAFPGTTPNYFWTATATAGLTANAWAVYFYEGWVRVEPTSTMLYARCVR
jgi:hypothetical protein